MSTVKRMFSAIGFGALMLGGVVPVETPPPMPARAVHRRTAKEKRAIVDRYVAAPRHKHRREAERRARQIRAGMLTPVFSAADPRVRVA